MRVLLTRPAEDSRATARALEADGLACLIWPLTRIELTAASVDVPAGTQGLLFSSANAVRAFAHLSARRDLPALAVGAATARAAREAGFAEVRSAGGDARALAALARESGLGAFLYPRGRDTAADLAGWLAAEGLSVTEAVLYAAVETGPPPAAVAAALAGGAVQIVTVWSKRGGAILARRLPEIGAALRASELVAISEAAAAPLAGLGFGRRRIAAAPGGAEMLAAIRAAARERR